MDKPVYKLKSKVWLYPGLSGWHFVTIEREVSNEIKKFFGHSSRGFGSIRVIVTVGESVWRTSIFPDKKTNCYILPLKSSIRKKENIVADKKLLYSIEIIA